MASDKEKMLRSANSYAGYVSDAKKACKSARDALSSPISTISEEWNGASGEAMKSALEDMKSELNLLYNRLATLESQMRTRANTIYNSWPEEEDVDM